MQAAVLRYRVMAYITGVLIIIVCFAGIPLQVAAHITFIVNDIGTVHGFLYIVYVIIAFTLFGVLQGLNTGIKQAIASTHADRLYVSNRLRLGAVSRPPNQHHHRPDERDELGENSRKSHVLSPKTRAS